MFVQSWQNLKKIYYKKEVHDVIHGKIKVKFWIKVPKYHEKLCNLHQNLIQVHPKLMNNWLEFELKNISVVYRITSQG